MTVLYADFSHHDWDRVKGELDWAAIYHATSPVVSIRATYGDPAGWHRDTHHHGDMQRGAAAAGFDLRGSYHNLVKGDAASIARQVDWLRAEMDRYDVTWGMVDVEPYPELVSADMWPRWDDVRQFHDRWHAIEGRVLAWYIPKWFWATRSGPDLGSPDLTVLHGPLVQSHYAGGDGTVGQIYTAAGGDSGTGWDDRYGGRYPDVWQYTSSANVPGASGSTDVNAFRGTLAQLRALLTGDDMTPEELRDKDIWPNGYGDKITNPTIAFGTFVRNVAAQTDATLKTVAGLAADVAALKAAVATLAGKDFTDEAAIVAGVLATLTPQAIAAAIPATQARAVADELAARLQA